MKRLFEVDTICRLCLRDDEKVNRLKNTDQKVFIESIIKLKQENYVPTDDLYICYICSALLTKSFNFMKTIWSAQKIVCAILKNTNMITKQLLYCIDRHNTGLNPITLTTVLTFFDNVKCESSENTSSESNTIADLEEPDLDLLIKKEKPRKQKKPNMNKMNYHSKNKNKLIISDEDESDKCNLNEIKVEMYNDLEIEFIKAESSDPLTKEFIKDEPIPETKKPVITKNRDLEKSPSNENKLILSISDEDEESEKNNVDEMEVEIFTNFEIDGIQTESSDPLTKELNIDACDEAIPKTKKKTVRKKNTGLKKKPHIRLESEDSSTDEKKRKYDDKDIDYDYQPDSTSHSEDSDYDSYDDEGKPIKRPKDDRVYPMKCDHCDFEVLEKRNHYRHYLVSHPSIEYPYKHIKEYACSICGILCTKQRIVNHEANHTTQEHKCYFCPKVFSNKTRRQRHVLSVHPRRTVTCNYCSKTFKTRGDLTRHLRTHTGSKPFKCHICGDGFAHSGNRSIHIRSKHQNYKCASRVRRNKKHYSTDTEISANSEETVQTETIRRSNNQSENTEVTLKKKRKSTKQRSKNKEVGGADTAMVSEDGKKNNSKEKIIQIVSDMNMEQGSKNYVNAEIESEDEILSVIKRSFF